ncbi:turripeptide Lol9.1-like isoform X2 [Diaphorina citri]|uniref:Turripeptide Lol9.1-like isoform X2 n=1 Tax=Diaphorina citri TaxID=121845 RepID=A0A1S3D859_DIACI|nr:turripeptide Lol9.1-like isoform X2 [Diaphorina citri]
MHLLFLVLYVGLLLDTIGAGVKAMNYKRCGTLPCSDEYEPVCGAKLMGNGFKTFSNPCEMEYYNCLRGPVYKKRHDGECQSLYSGWIWS